MTAVVIIACALAALALFIGLVGIPELMAPRVLCLMYHRLASREDFERAIGTEQIYTLPADEFERQVVHLKQAGFSFATPKEIHDYVTGRGSLERPAVLITFDDGCRSVLRYAKPILARHGARATVFVTTDPDAYVFNEPGVNDPRMTDDELREVDCEVVQCEAHGKTHLPLSGMSDEGIRRDLSEARSELEQILGREVRYLAIPGNWFDRRVMRIAREVGYEAVWFSFPGTTRRGVSVWGLPRINIEGIGGTAAFSAAIEPRGIVQRRLISLIKRLPGRVLGPGYWLPLRKLVLSCTPGGYLSMRRIATALIVFLASLIAAIAWWLL